MELTHLVQFVITDSIQLFVINHQNSVFYMWSFIFDYNNVQAKAFVIL